MMQQMINGLSLGSIYALLALGYTMVYGIIKLINFAHGDIYMLGAFWGYYAINFLHLGFVAALLSAMVMASLSGVLIEYLAYRPLRNSPRIAALITAIGVSFFLENGMSFLFGANARNFPQVITTKTYYVFGVGISNVQLLILSTSLLLMVLLQFIIKQTTMGKAMRAVAVDPQAAQLVGINPKETADLSRLIARVREHFGITVVLIEHDMSLVMNLAEYIYVLDHGAMIAEGTPQVIQRDPQVIRAYLGGDVHA